MSKNVYQVGVQMKSPVYNAGPQMWTSDHVIVYPNGTVVSKGFNAGQKVRKEDLSAVYKELYGGIVEHPVPRRREAVEHTRRKLGL